MKFMVTLFYQYEPNLLIYLIPSVNSCINNIIDFNSIEKFVTKSEPEIIFHLIAQPSVLKVRRTY